VALGIPVVVSRLETLAGHFGPDEVTFFEPGDAASLADAIRWVAANPEAAREKCERSRVRAREYAWTTNARRYVGLLAQLDPAGAPAAGG
jgi:glycosyltransferase involved in cell wall biosynthesis